MNAGELFRIGDRVRLSALGKQCGARKTFGGGPLGTITEFTADGGFAWVLWDGAGAADSYPGAYLDLVPADPSPRRHER